MRRRRFTINLREGMDAAALHADLRAVLPLPEHYGDNLDALYDVLTEFGSTWTLIVRGDPPDAFRAVCEDAVRETPGLVVRFVKPARR